MEQYLDLFLNYLLVEKGLSHNTLDAYGRDLARYLNFLEKERVSYPDEIPPLLVLRFLAHLKEAGLSPRSRARSLVSLRMFHKFLLAEGIAEANPTSRVEAPKSMNALPYTLSPAEVERLLAAPGSENPLDLRDRAMLEGLSWGICSLMPGTLQPLGKDANKGLSLWESRPLRSCDAI
jgi:integrase/recombinase XerD